MEIFVKIKTLLRFLGFLQIQHSHSKAIQLFKNIMCYLNLILLFSPSLWFFYFNAENFVQQAESFFVISGSFFTLSMYCILMWKRNQISTIITQLQSKVIEREKHTMTMIVYKAANEKIEKWIKKMLNIQNYKLIPLYFFPSMIFSYFSYYALDLSEESFRLMFPATFPYNWKTANRYFLIMALQFMELYYYVAIISCIFFIYYGFCIFFVAFTEDLVYSLDMMQNKMRSGVGRIGRISVEASIEIKNELYENIQFHSDSKQLVVQFSNAYTEILTALFSLSTSNICVTLLQILVSLTTSDVVNFVLGLEVFIIWLLSCFILSYYGEKVTSCHIDLSDSVYEMPWYSLPLKLQSPFEMMIMISQKPVHLQGFGKFKCTRETFKMVVNAAFSYFMILRRFSE